MEVAQKEHLPVMPIVVAAGKDAFHTLLGNPTGQKAMIAALIRESKDRGYTGFQFDFEDISWTDRDALSALVKSTADALHAEGLKLSIATVPNAPGYPGKGGFAKWIYEDWRGAYDLAAIGQSVDLVCLMTYDQNTRWTMPGPVAGWNWTVQNLDYAFKFVPKEKLSLGIPVYGYHWYAGAPIRREDPETKKRRRIAECNGGLYQRAERGAPGQGIQRHHPVGSGRSHGVVLHQPRPDAGVGLLHRQANVRGAVQAGAGARSRRLLLVGAG